VQWTRLPEGEATEKFCARVKHLLGGSTLVPERLHPDPRDGDTAAPARPKLSRPWLVPAALGAAVLIALALWQPWKKPATTAPMGNAISARTDPATAATKGPSREATESEKNFARMAAIYAKYGDATHEELVLAEDLGVQLVKKEPTNANAWAAYAHATLARVQFDAANEEYPAALSRAQRAASLEAEGFEPRFALASVYSLRSVTRDDGVRVLRKLADEKPDDVRVALSLARGLSDGGEHDGALKALARPGAAAEKNPYVWNLRSGILMVQMRLDEAITAIDQSISLNVGPAALMQRGYIQVFLQDDYRAAAETISSIPGSFLIRENETWAYGWFWLNHRNPEKSLARWRAFDGDFVLSAPKGYYVGRALEMSGQLDAAKFEWRAALRLVESKLATEPDNKLLLCWKAMLAACLEEKEQSQQALAVVRALEVNGTNAYLVPLVLARLGRNDEAIAGLSARWEKLGSNAARFARTIILHEALFDPLRGDARFQSFVEKIRNDPRFPIPAKKNPADQSSPAVAKPDDKAVAVLPFANVGGDKEQENFSDGLTLEIHKAIERERDLRVTGPTSSFSFKGKNVSAAEIAKALNVSRLVEGSVQRMGSKVRIRVSLTRVADNVSEDLGTFTEEFADIFSLYDKVAGAVVGKLTRRQIGSRVEVLTKNSKAYSAYLKGRAQQTLGITSAAESAKFYEQAVALDPGFALAWARLADARFRRFVSRSDRSPEVVKATRSAIDHALGVQPNLPEALVARANWLRLVDNDFAAARRDLMQAEVLQPATADLRMAQFALALDLDERPESFRLAKEVMELDPQNADNAAILAGYFAVRGSFREADRLFVRVLEISPANLTAFGERAFTRLKWRGPEAALRVWDRAPSTPDRAKFFRADMLLALGRNEDARAAIEGLVAPTGVMGFGVLTNNAGRILFALGLDERARVWAAAARDEASKQFARGNYSPLARLNFFGAEIVLGNRDSVIAELKEWRTETQRVPSVYRRMVDFNSPAARVYARLGMADETVALLQEFVANGFFSDGFWLRYGSDFALVRNDPRFQELMKQAEAWAKAQPDPVDL
jgi:TolB-like protein/tetratricopeptide (TPR) repeat protein